MTPSIKTEFGTKESPYVLLFYWGFLVTSDVLSLTTSCKMDLYRFPFDTQSCSITFQSSAYSYKDLEIRLLSDEMGGNISFRDFFEVQGEWELLNINFAKAQATGFWYDVDQLIFQITIKRRPLLYLFNIILPVFFFILLDVASFFIDTSGSDKLCFKVTLLLSISVLLLILNDTLPSTADKIPLIGVYCCGIFCLIGISILETILVNYLMAKGAESRSLVETTAAVTGCDAMGSPGIVKKCAPSSDCENRSINIGSVKLSSYCCGTDMCNDQDAPDFSDTPNGNKCYFCDGESSCLNVLSCSGSEDRCIIGTETNADQTLVMKGCASKSACDAGTLLSSVGLESISCCKGNLCNGAQSVTQSFLFLGCSLLSYFLLH
ncbi:unnamed protein product [Leuciscus chuanchicus]